MVWSFLFSIDNTFANDLVLGDGQEEAAKSGLLWKSDGACFRWVKKWQICYKKGNIQKVKMKLNFLTEENDTYT